jgi:FtsP/CotA-like multicopper oxidase with cupredoxin domain
VQGLEYDSLGYKAGIDSIHSFANDGSFEWDSNDLFKDTISSNSAYIQSDNISIDVRAFQHNFHPKLPKVWVLGYVESSTPEKEGKESLPGPSILADYNQEMKVTFHNKLLENMKDTSYYSFPNGWYPIVYDINTRNYVHMVAESLYPNPNAMSMNAMESARYYSTTVHLHGANVGWQNDGYPFDSLFEVNKFGQALKKLAISVGLFGGTLGKDASHKYYNSFPESEKGLKGKHGAILWYHDHAMMRTTTNVYAGMAGAYIIRGNGEKKALKDLLDSLGQDVFKDLPDIPLLIGDKKFTKDGKYLFYNTTQYQYPDTAAQPEFLGNCMVVNGKVWPKMNVNKGLYRFRLLNTSSARFLRLALVKEDASGKKIINDSLMMRQIGTEGGLMFKKDYPKIRANKENSLLLAPGERADVLINFSEIESGSKISLVNLATNEIHGENDYFIDDDSQTIAELNKADGTNSLTHNVMQFVVGKPLASKIKVTNSKLDSRLKNWSFKNPKDSGGFKDMSEGLEGLDYMQKDILKSNLKKLSKTNPQNTSFDTIQDRKIHFLAQTVISTKFIKDLTPKQLDSLVNVSKNIKKNHRFEIEIREVSNPQTLQEPQFSKFKSFVDLHGTMKNNLPYPFVLMGKPTEIHSWDSEACDTIKVVGNRRFEIWEIKNMTKDTHPIHIHLNRFRVLGRQKIDTLTGNEFTGEKDFFAPELSERGWKDVVRAKPYTETYILIEYVLNKDEEKNGIGHFVYHCHILEHEDAGMMRRLIVSKKPLKADLPTGTIPVCRTPAPQ